MKSFRLLTLAAFAAATVPRLAHRGMFVDGVTYASIARNLAEGRGSFWSPSYTATLYPQFHEHPPLGFWLQSLWFRVLGDHLFVERLYTVTLGLATAVPISGIWRRLKTDEGPATAGLDVRDELDWVPVALWIAVPVVSWAIVGNLLETTVTLFTTGAVLAALTAVVEPANTQPSTPRPQRPPNETAGVLGDLRELCVKSLHLLAGSRAGAATVLSVLSGLCVVGAALTKGPVGLFPLVAPVAFLLLANGRLGWRALLTQWTTVAACALLLWTAGAARASLTEYVNQQVLAALAGEREVSNSMTIVKMLLQGVMLPMAGVGALAVAAARRFVTPSPAALRRALVFFLLGLAGTLPILASAKQAGHYLVPAVPLFALAAALLIGPTVGVVGERLGAERRRTVLNIVIALMALGTVGASLSPAIGRDRGRVADLDAMASTVPRDRTVGLCPGSNDDWGLHAWFERRFHVSLDARGGRRGDWFLQTARDTDGCVPTECAAATDPRRQLVLMRCRRSD